jgi:REP element-mobilizing transposase RayT
MAYFITFTSYGARLHGNEHESVDAHHNVPGTPKLAPNRTWVVRNANRMAQPPYTLDSERRAVVLRAIVEVCRHRGWTLNAVHVRSNHVHAVIACDSPPELVMTTLKGYASRALTAAGYESADRRRWARHGSTRYLWTTEDVGSASTYVVYGQGEPMAVWRTEESRDPSAAAP